MKRTFENISGTEHKSSSDGDSERVCYADQGSSMSSKIHFMMYTFGDVKEPNKESVDLMYTILRDQMNILLIEAENAARLRKSTEICHKDLLYVMRKSKIKLKRLLDYLRVLDMQPKLMTDGTPEGNPQPVRKGKNFSKCMKFLDYIGDCQEFTSLAFDRTIDHTETRRRERQDLMATEMTVKEYKEFSQKRLQTSFCARNRTAKFKEWLLKDCVTKCQLTPLAVLIIAFLARETIAEIIDLALFIKSQKLEGADDSPYIRFTKPIAIHKQSGRNFHLKRPEDKNSENKADSKLVNSTIINAKEAISVIEENIPIHRVNEDKQEMDESLTTPEKDQSVIFRNCTGDTISADSIVSSSQESEHLSIVNKKFINNISDSITDCKVIDKNSNSESGKLSEAEIYSEDSTYLIVDDSDASCSTSDTETLSGRNMHQQKGSYTWHLFTGTEDGIANTSVNSSSERENSGKHASPDNVADAKETESSLKISTDGISNTILLRSVSTSDTDHSAKDTSSDDVNKTQSSFKMSKDGISNRSAYNSDSTSDLVSAAHDVKKTRSSFTIDAEFSDMSSTNLITSCMQEHVRHSQNSLSQKGKSPLKYNVELLDISEDEQNSEKSNLRKFHSADIENRTAKRKKGMSTKLLEEDENEFLLQTAIIPDEIREAFSRLQEIPPLFTFFPEERNLLNTKLLCLIDFAASFENIAYKKNVV